MRNKTIIYLLIIVGLIFATSFVFAKIEMDNDFDGLSDKEEQKVYKSNLIDSDTDKDGYQDGLEVFNGYSPTKAEEKLTEVILDVPYINEAPDDNWTGPWKNACEEASMAIVEKYYTGKNPVSIKEAKTFMMALFTHQNNIWGSNADSDAYRTARLINGKTNYNAKIIDNPTVEEIKKELQQKRPVISLHYGKDLKNKNIPFLRTGSYYHMMVIIGYDDNKQQFITNDTGDRVTGKCHPYDYQLFMNTLHDFDFKTRKANGPARVIFTYPKLVKTFDSPKVYYLKDDTKQWIVDEKTFNAKRFNWDAINVVDSSWLNNFESLADIKI
jgi:hypothetical protein